MCEKYSFILCERTNGPRLQQEQSNLPAAAVPLNQISLPKTHFFGLLLPVALKKES